MLNRVIAEGWSTQTSPQTGAIATAATQIWGGGESPPVLVQILGETAGKASYRLPQVLPRNQCGEFLVCKGLSVHMTAIDQQDDDAGEAPNWMSRW